MNKIIKLTIISVFSALIMGCSAGDYNDIKVWMKDQEKSLKGKVEPIPPAKSFVPVDFVAVQDPFLSKPLISLHDLEKNKFAPDNNRTKEPLESYPLDSMKFLGTLSKDNKYYAMIKTNDNLVHYVKVGNYFGTNFGRVIKLDSAKITLDERILDSTDEWKEKITEINLYDELKK